MGHLPTPIEIAIAIGTGIAIAIAIGIDVLLPPRRGGQGPFQHLADLRVLVFESDVSSISISIPIPIAIAIPIWISLSRAPKGMPGSTRE